MKANTRPACGGKEREDVRNDSPYFTGSSAHWCATCLASQPVVGILPQRWPGTDPSDCGSAPAIWPDLRGVRASSGEGHQQ